jgi:hypothetical protein
MTNPDGLAVLLFVINSATGNGLAALHFCLKNINIGRLIALLRADARARQRVPRVSARSARTRCLVRTRNEIR